ncbi:MAG: hemerythrin domain-containing protein [Clostridia bacterium]|nr:hemerythrin domain-containing protein [Clostridia bacterium]
MEKTLRFRKQHEEITQLAENLSSFLKPERLRTEAKTARLILAKLAGVLNIHLAAEDNVLYPNLLNSDDEQIKVMAQKYIAEMSALKNSFNEYLKKWPSPLSLQNNPEQFIEETKQIFEILGQRIQRENDELYTLVDKKS